MQCNSQGTVRGVTATGWSKKLVEKWQKMLPEWKWREPWWGEWPDCAVADGNAVGNMLEQVRDEGATPRWVVVDGGALSKGTVEAMKAAGLRMWAVRMSVSV